MMKERPILMTPENAQKCHVGVKTQTRRIIKQKHLPFLESLLNGWLDGKWNQRPLPYGVVGDRLWVREAFGIPDAPYERQCRELVVYRGEQSPQLQALNRHFWRASLRMPRWACRTVLELTAVRVERLQEITADDIRAEGVKAVWPELDEPESAGGRCVTEAELLRSEWIKLWESINGAGSWALNPWVWVLSFRKVTP